MSNERRDAITKHAPWVISLLVNAVVIAFLLGGLFNRVAQTEKDIADLKANERQNDATVSDIKSDVKVIAEWVREQKAKEK